jgi:Flp pilus assembly protein TadG
MTIQRFFRDRAGSSAVEFALLSPVFFAIAFGIVDAGRLVWTQMSIEHAVESAARCASIQSTNCTTAPDVQTYAATQAPGLGLSPSAFSYSTPSCGSLVSATYRYYYLSAAFPGSYSTLTAQSCVPVAPT